MEKFKSGFVAIIGKTNVGKSTLINCLANEKIAITTSKPQTTRTEIKAIINRENSQIIFIDTPGIHKPKNKLGKFMIETAINSIQEADIVLFIVDAKQHEINEENRLLLDKLKEKKRKVILVINKIDLVKKESLLKEIENYRKEYEFSAVILLSALKGEGKEELLTEIEKELPEGPAYYDKEEYTTQTTREIIEEIIREKALKLLSQEIPHGIYVEVSKMKKRKTSKGEKIFDVEAVIYCTKKSHKGIIIGKDGAMLKKIGSYSRENVEKMLKEKVNLKLWVKVQENWVDNSNILKKFKNTQN